jgi:hypothetical protein
MRPRAEVRWQMGLLSWEMAGMLPLQAGLVATLTKLLLASRGRAIGGAYPS